MSNIQYTGGVSFSSLLTIVFIFLKLTGQIAWSWWWVLAPIWIPLCLVLVLLGILGLVYFANTRN